MERLLTAAEVADLLRVSRATVYRWVDDGRLPAIQLGGRTIRFNPRAIDHFLAELVVEDV